MSFTGVQDVLTEIALPAGLQWGLTVRSADRSLLFPQEELAIQRAVPRRVSEFIGGRVAARQAMRKLGIQPGPIPMGPDRAPIWPMGTVGSISHAGDLCLATVARTQDYQMIGVDLEPDTPLAADLVDEVSTADELSERPDAPPTVAAKRIFSAKEAVYKAIYPRLRKVVGFGAVTIRYTSEGEGEAVPSGAISGWVPMTIPFYQRSVEGWLITICAVAA